MAGRGWLGKHRALCSGGRSPKAHLPDLPPRTLEPAVRLTVLSHFPWYDRTTMFITRKQALLVLVAGLVPWVTRRAQADTGGRQPDRPAQLPGQTMSSMQKQLDDLTRRVAALEEQLTKQVGFTKDARGNLTLSAPGNVSVSAATNLELKSGATTNVLASGNVKVMGAMIHLN